MSEPTPSLSVEAMWRVEEACLRFEDECKEGQQPRIEDFLAGECDLERSSLLRQLLLLDCDYRQRAGASTSVQEYLDRFPNHAALVREVCARTAQPPQAEAPQDLTGDTVDERPQSDSVPSGAEGAQSEGVSVPGYEILEELGRGGMGVVYKARHLRLNRVVALKMILSGAHAGPDDLARFVSEAEAVASFQHPHIVQVFEVNQHNQLPYMALEFVVGGSLGALLKQGPLVPRQAAHLVEQIAQGMNAAHQAGIIHRDLKPDNVLLTLDGFPKITDFGLAKKVEGGAGVTQTGNILGTPSYMAPEQARGEGKRVGPSADVYALGAVLYACLTGRPPFQASTQLETILKVLSDEPRPPTQLNRKIPPDLEVICLKCLHKSPSKRYQSAQKLAEDLERFLEGESITARRASRAERLGRWCRRHPVRLVATLGGTAAVLLLVVSAIILFLRTPNGTVRIEINDPKIKVSFAGNTYTFENAGETITVKPGKHSLLVQRGDLQFQTPQFTLGSRKNPSLRVEFLQGQIVVKQGDKELVKGLLVPGLGWFEGKTELWSVKDGVLVGSTEPKGITSTTNLCSKKQYSDFELSFQVRLKGGKGNSGVHIRSQLINRRDYVVRGPQGDMGPRYWGSLYGENFGGMMKRAPRGMVQKVLKKDDFNDYYIKAVGKHITIKLNGKKMVDDDFDAVPATGIIAFQLHSGEPMETTFRNIKLRTLVAKESDGWTQLFNGKNLTGWSRTTKGLGNWKVVDGAITCTGPTDYLYTDRNDFGNFHLRAQVKINAAGNSGICFRTAKPYHPQDDYEAQIALSNRGPDYRTGSLFLLVKEKEPPAPANLWFTYEIITKGKHIQLLVNGKETASYVVKKTDRRAQVKGYIGLQHWTPRTQVSFKTIEIKELPSTKD